MEYELDVTQLRSFAPQLHAGDRIILSGTVFTSRDAAHGRIIKALEQNQHLPYPLKDAVIYYAGPTPTPEHLAIGSCGPTTSGRMDVFTPALLAEGLIAMIGKGERSKCVCDAIVEQGAVYLCAIGGAGALASKCITSCEVIAYEDLGCESVKKLTLSHFPLIVGIDCHGGNVFVHSQKQ